MNTIADIYKLIESECGIELDKLNSNSDLMGDLGIYGDDFDELMLAYAKKFDVNLDSYLWYFHSCEEVGSPFTFIFPPPNKRVKRIVITPELLSKYANLKKWAVKYPEHSLPKYRWDIISLKIFFVLCALLGVFLAFVKS